MNNYIKNSCRDEDLLGHMFACPLTVILTTCFDQSEFAHTNATGVADNIVSEIRKYVSEKDQVRHIGGNKFMVVVNDDICGLVSTYNKIIKNISIHNKQTNKKNKIQKRVFVSVISEKDFNIQAVIKGNELRFKSNVSHQDSDFFDISPIECSGGLQ